MLFQEEIKAVVSKAVNENLSMEELEYLFKPTTVGELMARLFGLKYYRNFIDEAIDKCRLPYGTAGTLIGYAYTVAEREELYLALKEALYDNINKP